MKRYNEINLLADIKKLLGNDKKSEIVQKDTACTRTQILLDLTRCDFCGRLSLIPGAWHCFFSILSLEICIRKLQSRKKKKSNYYLSKYFLQVKKNKTKNNFSMIIRSPAFIFVFCSRLVPMDSFHLLRGAVASSVTLEI